MILKNCGFYLFISFCLTSSYFVSAQDYLGHNIKFEASEQVKLGEVMDRLSLEQDFYFSYQSSLINLDKTIMVSAYEGNVSGFLREVFGEAFDFREHEEYVIIKYAPGKLDIDIDKSNKASFIRGKVLDFHTGEPVPFASVYEKNSLISALSEENGEFELKFKNQSSDPIWLTISKEDYRDTTFIILPTVDVGVSKRPNKMRFYPENGSVEKMENSYLGRMFIGFRQRVQRLNLGGFFVESPLQVSLTPGLSSQGVFNSQMINNFSLNVVGGYTAGVEGVEAAGIFNINQKNVVAFQVAGIFNMTGGDVDGFQAAGVLNQVYGDVSGFQVAGIYNHVRGVVNGVQVGGLYNNTAGEADIQIAGLFNKSLQSNLLQIAGLTNHAKTTSEALQIAGLYNYSSGEVGYQIAGLVNRAENVSGVQFSGLINIAKSSDYPIGLINLIEDGQQSLSLGLDETGYGQITFRSGGKKVYGLIGVGLMSPQGKQMYGLDLGLGWHLFNKERFSMDIEFVNRQTTTFSNLSNNISFIRWLPGYKVSKKFRLIAGPTFGFSVFDKNWVHPTTGYVLADKSTSNGRYALNVGFYGGVQYLF